MPPPTASENCARGFRSGVSRLKTWLMKAAGEPVCPSDLNRAAAATGVELVVSHNLPARFSRRRTSSYGTSFLEDRSARSRASASSRSPSFWSIRRYWFTSSKTASLRPLVPTTNFGAVPIGEIIALTREAVHAGQKRVEVSFGMGSPSKHWSFLRRRESTPSAAHFQWLAQ